jgi:glycosyltransferase involved in cell wall biosynthesis
VTSRAKSAREGHYPRIVIASMLREDDTSGVQSYIKRLRHYLGERGVPTTLVTPFSWGGPLLLPVFAPRLLLKRVSGPANVVWYRHWHGVFLRLALQSQLASAGECVVFAQDPVAARAALRARQGAHQRVVMVVHFRISQADEWADKRQIRFGGTVFRAIRQLEREVIPKVDGLVFMSQWARRAVLDWLPEAASIPSRVVGSIVTPLLEEPVQGYLGDLVTIGNLEFVKNHRFLLAVVAEAKRAGRVFTLDVFGKGPLLKKLSREARILGVGQQIRFRGFQPDVRKLLPGYRAYVHASYSESFCLAIAEAMAAGLPILTSDIGPIPELCSGGVECRFWSLDDPVQAAAALIDVLDDEVARSKLGRAARERFVRDLAADQVVPQLMSFLVELCGEATLGARRQE